MSISEKLVVMFEERLLEQILRSWCLADKETRKHRLRTVIELTLELEKIKKVSLFSTAFGEMAIEAVIQGDWQELKEIINFQDFRTEDAKIREEFAPLWENFRVIAQTAIAEEQRRNG
jgi:hypothetical protein